MNNCSNCGSNVYPGENFCRVCGHRITNNQPSLQSNLNAIPSADNTFDFDNDLINAYIGSNAGNLKTANFSVPAFFFGSLYAFYRKMWLVGFGLIAISFIVNMFLGSIANLILLCLNLYYSYQFNKWYYSHVLDQVNKIKQENHEKTREELITICAQRGGTTVVPVIIMAAIYLILIIVLFISLMGLMGTGRIVNPSGPKNETINNLSYTVPDGYTINSSNSTNKIYSKSPNNEVVCSLNVRMRNSASYDYNARLYLEDSIKNTYNVPFEVTLKNINNNNWYYTDFINESFHYYHYATTNSDKIYLVSFAMENNKESICMDDYNSVINSLEVR